MPATLNEAFISPFDKVQGQSPIKGEDSGTTDIRNPLYQDNTYQQNFHVPSAQPMNSIYSSSPPQLVHPVHILEQSQAQQAPQYPDQLQGQMQDQAHGPMQMHMQEQVQVQGHNCDQLIAGIMSCRVCRQKLQDLLSDYNRDREQGQDQKGGTGIGKEGNILDDIIAGNSNLLVNIVIGVALIFLLDRILKLRS